MRSEKLARYITKPEHTPIRVEITTRGSEQFVGTITDVSSDCGTASGQTVLESDEREFRLPNNEIATIQGLRSK